MAEVTILDYGCGNILSIANAMKACQAKVELTKDPKAILNSNRLVLPGVGAFGHCVESLQHEALFETIKIFIATGRPVLGICVGMQMLLTQSHEYGIHLGLDIIPGVVTRISQENQIAQKKVPYVGWAKIALLPGCHTLFDMSTFSEQWFYFVHSFVARPSGAQSFLGYYRYLDENITALIAKDNVLGCQFHPEKSGQMGLKFLEKFLKN